MKIVFCYLIQVVFLEPTRKNIFRCNFTPLEILRFFKLQEIELRFSPTYVAKREKVKKLYINSSFFT